MVLRYLSVLSKNWKVDVLHCAANNLRKEVVDRRIADVINAYTYHKDDSSTSTMDKPHPLFFTPVSKWQLDEALSYSTGPLGRYTLTAITKKLWSTNVMFRITSLLQALMYHVRFLERFL